MVLRGTLERFGLYPQDAPVTIAAQQPITKLDGGTVAVQKFFSLINKAKIEIPPDPYPDRPESFTKETAVPVNDPADTMDCLWEDTVISIGQPLNPPAMKTARAVGPRFTSAPTAPFSTGM